MNFQDILGFYHLTYKTHSFFLVSSFKPRDGFVYAIPRNLSLLSQHGGLDSIEELRFLGECHANALSLW